MAGGVYALWAEFLDENEEDTPVRWSPLPPDHSVTAAIDIRRMSLPASAYDTGEAALASPQRRKISEMLTHKPYFVDQGDSEFQSLPDELIAKLSSYLNYKDVANCKLLNSQVCKVIMENWKHMDKTPLEVFAISHERRDVLVSSFLHQKATYRALLTANDMEVLHIEVKTKSGHSWWNYQIRTAGEGDRIADDECPEMYYKVQSAPGVQDKQRALLNHLDYFWSRSKIVNLVLNDVTADDMGVIISAQKRTACTIHRLTLNTENGNITGDHVDLVNLMHCPEVCIDLYNGGKIYPRLWFSRALQTAHTIMIRNRQDIKEITDNVFLSWKKAEKIHLCCQTSVSVFAIIQVIREWLCKRRAVTFICFQQRFGEVNWGQLLSEFPLQQVESSPTARSIRSLDGEQELICTWGPTCFQMGSPEYTQMDFDPVFTYLGGKRL